VIKEGLEALEDDDEASSISGSRSDES
jgi:hypothetical protein